MQTKMIRIYVMSDMKAVMYIDQFSEREGEGKVSLII